MKKSDVIASVKAQALALVIADIVDDIAGTDTEFVVLCVREDGDKGEITLSGRVNGTPVRLPEILERAAQNVKREITEFAPIGSKTPAIDGSGHKH